MDKKKVFFILLFIFNGYVFLSSAYNIYKNSTDGVKEMFLDKEVEILEQEYRLDFSKTGIRAGYYDGDGLVINIGPFFDKESMLEVFDFKNDELYEETLKRCDLGGVRYKQCFGAVYDAYVISTSVELASEISYRVYIYMLEEAYYIEIEKDEVELVETIEIFD